MGGTRGNQGVVDGVDGRGDVGETPLSSSPAMTEHQPALDDDRLGPFQVVEVRDTPTAGLKARWLDRLGDRRQPAALGVALGLVVSVVAIGAASRSQTANEIGSALLPAAWSAPDGVDSASGGGNDDGGRSTFSRLLFGGDTDENVSEDDDGARDEDASDLVADERSDDVDVDDAEVSAEDDSTDGESANGDPADNDSTDNDSADNDSAGNETAGADPEAGVVDPGGQGDPGNAGSSTSTTDAAPATTVGGPTTVSPPTSVATTRPSSTTPTTASTTTEATVPSTTVATSTTTTTTSRPTVAAPTGCEVQTSTSGVRTTGVEIHEPSEEFARQYVLYDADLREVIRVSEPQQVEGPEIEFESEAIGFDADVIHYAAAVSEGVVSAPTACERRV